MVGNGLHTHAEVSGGTDFLGKESGKTIQVATGQLSQLCKKM